MSNRFLLTLFWPILIGALAPLPGAAQTPPAAPHVRQRATEPIPATPLGFAEALELAGSNQPLLAAQRAAVDASLAEAIAATQLPDPKLKLGVQNVPTNSFSLGQDSMTMRAVSVEQAVPRQEKRRLRGERAEIEAQIGETEADNLRRGIRRDVALAWLSRYGAEQSDLLLREGVSLAMRQREGTQMAMRANRAGLQAGARAELEVQQALDRVSEGLRQNVRARAELGRLIGLHAERVLGKELPILPDPKTLEYLRDVADQNPQLGVARREIALAENALAQAKAATLADWSFEVGYAKRGPAYSDMVSAQITIDLPLFARDRQDRGVLAKQRSLERQQRMHEDHERMLQAELSSAYVDWSQTRERSTRYEQQVLPAARQGVDAALAEYRASRVELLAVIEAQRAELEARLQLLNLRVATAKARVQLQYLAE